MTEETKEAPLERPLLQLPTGAIVRVEDIAMITRVELNQYVIHFKGVTGVGAKATSEDLEALAAWGMIQKLPAPQPVAANDTKIEIAK